MKEKNIKELEVLVNQNNSEAMYELGDRYYKGKDVNIDYGKAKFYFEKAESLGNYKGKYAIGRMYYFGRGLEKNYAKAYNIFNELATRYNDQNSKYYLGEMYYLGNGIEQDYGKAYNIFSELTTKYDNKGAKYHLGEMYYLGDGIGQDYEKAYNIFNELATKYDDNYAKYYLGEMYYLGNGIEQDYGKAYNIFSELATKYDDEYAKCSLGEMYYLGNYVGRDYEKAKDLFEQVNGYPKVNAEYYLGKIFENGGYGVIQNLEKAEEFFCKIEKDICITLIYYIFAVSHVEKFTLNEIAKYDMEIVKRRILSISTPTHPARIYYKKWKSIFKKAYNDIIERLKVKLIKYKELEEKFLMLIEDEKGVEGMAQAIVYYYTDSEIEEAKQTLNEIIKEKGLNNIND